MRNIIQFAPIFSAAGCHLNLDTTYIEMDVVNLDKLPKKTRIIVDQAIEDVDKYLDTANYEDGIALIALADYVDNEPNPLNNESRTRLLTNLGLMADEKYISQVLAVQKNNRAWHSSDVAGDCTYFGKSCTHRGAVEVAGKRGRKATRSPEEYHRLASNGIIGREQLVTPGLQNLWDIIPDSRLTSLRPKRAINMQQLVEELTSEQLAELIEIKKLMV